MAENEIAMPKPQEITSGGSRKISDRVAAVLFAVIGAVMGYVSALLNQPLASLAIAIVVIVVVWLILKKGLKITEDKKWWTGKVALYIFMWFVIWTLFFNLLTVQAV